MKKRSFRGKSRTLRKSWEIIRFVLIVSVLPLVPLLLNVSLSNIEEKFESLPPESMIQGPKLTYFFIRSENDENKQNNGGRSIASISKRAFAAEEVPAPSNTEQGKVAPSKESSDLIIVPLGDKLD